MPLGGTALARRVAFAAVQRDRVLELRKSLGQPVRSLGAYERGGARSATRSALEARDVGEPRDAVHAVNMAYDHSRRRETRFAGTRAVLRAVKVICKTALSAGGSPFATRMGRRWAHE